MDTELEAANHVLRRYEGEHGLGQALTGDRPRLDLVYADEVWHNLSHGEQIIADIALGFWNGAAGKGVGTIANAIARLDDDNYRSVVEAMFIRRPPVGLYLTTENPDHRGMKSPEAPSA